MFARSIRPPEKDNPCCKHNTPECQQYQWWLKQMGKTVRVTRGAFAGYLGRLSGVDYASGQITHRSGCPPARFDAAAHNRLHRPGSSRVEQAGVVLRVLLWPL